MNGFIGVLKTILKFIVFCRHPEHICILFFQFSYNNNNNKISHRIGEHYFTDKSVLTQFPSTNPNFGDLGKK